MDGKQKITHIEINVLEINLRREESASTKNAVLNFDSEENLLHHQRCFNSLTVPPIGNSSHMYLESHPFSP
jgi:hypothetical protein